MVMFIIIGLIVLLIYFRVIRPYIYLSKLNLDSFTVVTGGVKTGKSTLAIYLAINKIRLNRLLTKIKNIFRKKKLQLPILYSNIPLYIYDNGFINNIKNIFRKKENRVYISIYAPLTKDILLRKVKPIEKSGIYMGEFSLISDSANWKDEILNEQTLLFFKLFGHEFGGYIIADTQNIEDCHYCIKRITTKYLWIYRAKKGLFNYNMWVKEIVYNYQNNAVINNINKKNIEEETNLIKVSKSIWNCFDYRCYSILTDNLKVQEQTETPNTLKQKNIVSFIKWKTNCLNNEKGVNNAKQVK